MSHTMGVLMPKKERGMCVYFSVSASTSFCWEKKEPVSLSHFPFLYQMRPFNHKSSSSTSHAQRERPVSQFNGSAFYICLSASSRFISQGADWSWAWLSPLISPLLRKGLRAINFKFEAMEVSKHFQMSIFCKPVQTSRCLAQRKKP